MSALPTEMTLISDHLVSVLSRVQLKALDFIA